MELSNGGDRVNHHLPNGTVILENVIYSDDGGNGNIFRKTPVKIAGREVEEGQLIQIINGNFDLLETLDISSNDSNCVDSGDDDHTTSQSDSLNGCEDDDEIEKREVVPVKTKVQDAVPVTPVNDEKSNGPHHHAYVHVTTMIMSKLPKPEAPPGITLTDSPRDDPPPFERSHSLPESLTTVDMPAIGKFFREKSNSLSAAITKRLASLTEYSPTENGDVSEFNLSGLKVIVKRKNNNESEKEKDETDPTELKGRITFFSRSRCRDCKAVRSFLRERRLKYVEINVDVFTNREKELISRTGSAAVPQIFFNEKLFGGLVALNSLRNSGTLEGRLKELLSKKCPESAPGQPVYGFDDQDEEEVMDEMVATVRVLRQRLPIQDRLMKMKIVKNCFSGAEMVEVLIQHFDCGRKKVRLTFFDICFHPWDAK